MLDKRLQSPVHDIYEGGQAGPVDLQDECVQERSLHLDSSAGDFVRHQTPTPKERQGLLVVLGR